ncbi:MAG: 2-hydroxyacid dehydrogenase [Casimicrobiaceae bacterium]
MNLLFYSAGGDGAEWLAALSRAFPAARVHAWRCAADDGVPAEPPQGIDYALVWKPPSRLLDEIRSVKAIFNLGAGVDTLAGIDRLAPSVPVVRLEDAGMAEQMAEYVTYVALGQFRAFDAYAAAQRAAAWRPLPRQDKRIFDVGMLGVGVLGAAVAAALRPFGFPLLGWSRTRKNLAGVESYAGRAELDAFLERCRVLVCLLPLTDETRGLLDFRALSRLPAGAHVVNVARGAVIVDEDLLALLDQDRLGGATLDVFRDEPLPAAHRFWHHPRITITPHVSAVTRVEASVAQIAAKIARLEAGLAVTGVVDRERAY